MRYRIYRGEDSLTMSLIDSTDDAWSVDTTGAPLRMYIYRVSAVDSTGFEGVPAHPVRAASMLGVPRLVSPAHGEQGLPLSALLVWKSVRAAERYILQVYADPGLTVAITDSAIADTSMVVNGVLENGRRYYWRVCALHPLAQGGWTEIRDFLTIVDTPSPSDPVLPPDQASVLPDSVVCVWTSSAPGVERYWFEIAADSGFTFRSIDSTLVDTMTTVQDLTGALSYWWRVRAYNPAGWGPYSAVRTFIVPPTSAEGGGDLPREYGLSQNYPNPFNPETAIRFQIPTGEHVRLSVFDMLGREVEVLVDEWRAAGRHEAIWDGSGAASGVYVCRLTAGSFIQIRRMMLLK